MQLPHVLNIIAQSIIKPTHSPQKVNVINHLIKGDSFNSLILRDWFEFIFKHSDVLLIIFIILVSFLSLTIQFLLIKWYLSIEKKKYSYDQGSMTNRFQIDDDDVQSVQNSILSSIINQ